MWIISLSSVFIALLMSISSDLKCICICIEDCGSEKETNSFFLTYIASSSLPAHSLPTTPPPPTLSRHKDTLFSLDCEHGSLSLNVSGKWLIWSHLPKSYWNAAVVGQLFKTPEIHRPRWHFPVFGTTIAIALAIFYMCVYIYHIFYKEHFTMKEETLLCLLSHKFWSSLYPPLDEKKATRYPNCFHEEELGINTRRGNVPWSL